MEANFPACLRHVFATEGGFSNDPSDHGGATNWGITAATLVHWRGRPVTAADVRGLAADEAKASYHATYWNTVRGGELPGGVDLVVFDVSVNSGPRCAVRMLQEAVGVNAVDGIFGPPTMKTLTPMVPTDIATRLDVARRRFHGSPVDKEPSQGWFPNGWPNRVATTTSVTRGMVLLRFVRSSALGMLAARSRRHPPAVATVRLQQ